MAALAFVPRGAVIGVGTGSTANHFIDQLAALGPEIDGAVASSQATAERLRRHGIRLLDLNDVERLPLYVDGADEALRSRELLKGGGGALTREKILACASDRFVCMVDEGKLVERLGSFPLPVEILALARGQIIRRMAELGGRALPRKGFVTDNGHEILDVHDLVIDDALALESELEQLPGLVASGLFARRRADVLLVARPSGVDTID
jgi:ribose 5-phosphate isomerase A